MLEQVSTCGFSRRGSRASAPRDAMAASSSPIFLGWSRGTCWSASAPARGARLLQRVADGADRIFALAREHGIACDARQGGWLCPAHAPALAGRLEARVRAWEPYAPRVRLLDRAETVRLTGCPGFHAAYLDPAGGRLNPLAYVRGLADAALRAGAHVHGDTAVTSLERIGGRWQLATASRSGDGRAGSRLRPSRAGPPCSGRGSELRAAPGLSVGDGAARGDGTGRHPAGRTGRLRHAPQSLLLQPRR